MSHIVVVEDEPVIRTALSKLLTRNGHQVSEADSVEALERAGPLETPELIIADLRLPGGPGTDTIRLFPGVPVLIMTSYASIRSAVEAMRLGAVDYIAKPFDHDDMLMTVRRILDEDRLQRQNRALKADVARSYPVAGMVGHCPAMQEVCGRIEKVAPTDTTVLIVGESGTGKELVARAVHDKSPRSRAPMITVNCAAIPGELIENELFGHEKGSFTGAVGAQHGVVEAAAGGTLFLDEIGDLPMQAQAGLLRVLQDGEIRRVGAARSKRVDIRLVAATHRDLPASVQEGTFREDLYFRLHVVEIRLPPLRDRGDDVLELANALLARSCERLHRPLLQYDPAAIDAMRTYRWPGNVRELEHAIERAVILCEKGRITPELLSLGSDGQPAPPDAPDDGLAKLSLEEYFRAFVLQHQDGMTETALAERLGISRKALWERRQKLGLHRAR